MQPNISKPAEVSHSLHYKSIEFKRSYPFIYEYREFSITYIKEGSGRLYVGGSSYEFRTGDIFLIQGGSRHYFKVKSEHENTAIAGLRTCSVYFDPRLEMQGFFNLPEMKVAEAGILMTNTCVKVPNDSIDFIRSKLLQMEECSGIKLMMTFTGLIGALYRIEKSVLFDSARIYYVFQKSDRIYPVLDYLNQHYDEKISLEQAAEMTCMTPNSFCRYFKKTTGRTLVSYVQELRIEQVCLQLLTSDRKINVVDLAYRVGFNTVSNFNRTFKAIKGMSPKKYLRKYTVIDN
ncbi:AraC family transcriptional regulator [Pedobacter sp. GR22-6]|uniref:AraC family transcriptional regulator n=1 Tax=Pedobacter sp. GR22-6 TaxID=3127957 RepID=UPI00307F3037